MNQIAVVQAGKTPERIIVLPGVTLMRSRAVKVTASVPMGT
jgi:hypothetical protein